jgi:hypothetical protein
VRTRRVSYTVSKTGIFEIGVPHRNKGHRSCCAVLGWGLLYALIAPIGALAWSDNPATPEGWAWMQIRAGKPADLNMRCGTTLDPRKSAGWEDPCRQISPQFLVDVLTVSKWKEQVPLFGVDLRAARIVGDLDLSNADINSPTCIAASRITGTLSLVDAHLRRLFSLEGSTLSGPLRATRMNAESLFTLRQVLFVNDVDLAGAKIASNLNMQAVSLAKTLHASDMDVQGDLFMSDHASFGDDVTLNDTKIGRSIDMETASFAKTLHADRIEVHAAIFMREHASFGGDVILTGATVGSNFDIETAWFAKTLTADSLIVRGSLFMRDHTFFGGEVILLGATIGGNLEMDTVSFAKRLSAERVQVNGSLFMRNHAYFGGDVTLYGAKIGNDLDMGTAYFSRALRGDGLDVRGGLLMNNHATFVGDVRFGSAKVGGIDLRSATVSSLDLSDLTGAAGSDLLLTGLNWRCREKPDETKNPRRQELTPKDGQTNWPLGNTSNQSAKCDGSEESLPRLILRGAHIESLQDDRDSWPPRLDLEGLRYDRLGGPQVVESFEKPLRTREEWVEWLGRNRSFSQQPYSQLAAVLASAGRRDTSEEILFAGRERERSEIWNSPNVGFWQWLRHGFWSWAWLSLLSVVTGYGIGLYTFRVLWWVIGLTVISAGVLRFSPYARERSVPWRLGASLHRLLPVVELNKEFKDFFDNVAEPDKPRKFYPWQMAFFSGIALAGWVLGFFLLAAMGGLIQK